MTRIEQEIVTSLERLDAKLKRGDLIECTRLVRGRDGNYRRIRGVVNERGEFEPFKEGSR